VTDRDMKSNETNETEETDETVEESEDAQDGQDADTGDTAVEESPERNLRRRRDRPRMPRQVAIVPLILVLLLLISGGAAAWMYFERYRPNQRTDAGVAQAVVSAATDGTVALLSYSPESLDKDFATAKSHLSGDFLSYYTDFTNHIVAPAAKEKSLKTTAHVVGAGIQELHQDSAVVLVYVDQSTISKDRPDPALTASSVLVSMTRVNGSWLINKFDPI
jgi:Mce-associated membrane protein